MKPIKNKKRIDPRYFLNETAKRGMEEGMFDKLKGMFGGKETPDPRSAMAGEIEKKYREIKRLEPNEKVDLEIAKKMGFLADYYIETGERLNTTKGERMFKKFLSLARARGPEWENFLSKYSAYNQ